MKFIAALTTIASSFALLSSPTGAQEYRHLDSGRPVRIGSAATAAFRELDIDLASTRIERLASDKYRLQLDPRISYGIKPNMEISLRMPLFLRERDMSPRSGIGGIGIGGKSLLAIETLTRPGLALAVEAFVPTGPNALGASFSAKALVTKTLATTRLHANASLGSYLVESPSEQEACATLPPGTPGCGAPIIPPIDGPCMASPAEPGFSAFSCSPSGARLAMAENNPLRTRTYGRWMAGIGIDRTFALQSVLIVADVFIEQFTGIERPLDITVEAGTRKQLRPWLAVDAGVGRKIRGNSKSTYLNAGATLTRPLSR